MDFLTLFGIALALVAVGFVLGHLYYKPLVGALTQDLDSAKSEVKYYAARLATREQQLLNKARTELDRLNNAKAELNKL